MTKVKTVISKEFWTYFGSRETLYSIILPAVSMVFVLSFVIVTRSQYITPQSRALAYKQITSNPQLFGITESLLQVLGDDAITIATLIVQIPMVIQIFSFISTYNAIVASFAFERINKTMEVLFASPLSESEIILGKIIASIIAGTLTMLSGILINVAAIQYVFIQHVGRLWTPTLGYMFLTVAMSISMLLFAIPIGLTLSVRAKNATQIKLGGLVGIMPLLLFLLASKVPPQTFFSIVQIIGLTSLVVSIILVCLSRRLINRFSFIIN
ncbi:hypothetical protein TEU_04340 [Thermococcus eurythermalis]|uniref:ABC-2 type transporter transmembrane domain-containing protein n=1 Tax=Thermococcus eurythermalis TaxID=1505907 RepID=A0A097QT21_9EURY|nr:ABC transporter permease [Thermococcus eurythermalis]AIU69627.1 hypothetical protein TEU_04340 [Thermococcus eurythermalis]